jgi:hypothetical protein
VTKFDGMGGEDLERERAAILGRIGQVGAFRRGSLETVWRKCGKPNCRCARPGEPGHGPTVQWTRTARGPGGSRGQAVPAGHVDQVRSELDRFADFQRLVDDYVEVNEQICVDHVRAARTAARRVPPAAKDEKGGSAGRTSRR